MKKTVIAVIDYGMGNLKSVTKAVEYCGFPVKVIREPEEAVSADYLVLPGVGAFGDCMKNLASSNVIEAIEAHVKAGKPFLGICLGLQALFGSSEESPGVKGLAFLQGTVKRFPQGGKIPHMGWNTISIRNGAELYNGVPDGSYLYFVHSYYGAPADQSVISASCGYNGVDFSAVVQYENITAFQFHPEKSQALGLNLLKNALLLS